MKQLRWNGGARGGQVGEYQVGDGEGQEYEREEEDQAVGLKLHAQIKVELYRSPFTISI